MKAIIYNENCLIASFSLIKEILVILILGENKIFTKFPPCVTVVTVSGRNEPHNTEEAI